MNADAVVYMAVNVYEREDSTKSKHNIHSQYRIILATESEG